MCIVGSWGVNHCILRILPKYSVTMVAVCSVMKCVTKLMHNKPMQSGCGRAVQALLVFYSQVQKLVLITKIET